MPVNTTDSGMPQRTCSRCGAKVPLLVDVCPGCGQSLPSLLLPKETRRDPARRLWIALVVAMATLLLSFCLLYAILQAFRR